LLSKSLLFYFANLACIIDSEAPNGKRYRRAGDLAGKTQSVESAVGAESPGAGRKPPPVRVHAMLATCRFNN